MTATLKRNQGLLGQIHGGIVENGDDDDVEKEVQDTSYLSTLINEWIQKDNELRNR